MRTADKQIIWCRYSKQKLWWYGVFFIDEPFLLAQRLSILRFMVASWQCKVEEPENRHMQKNPFGKLCRVVFFFSFSYTNNSKYFGCALCYKYIFCEKRPFGAAKQNASRSNIRKETEKESESEHFQISANIAEKVGTLLHAHVHTACIHPLFSPHTHSLWHTRTTPNTQCDPFQVFCSLSSWLWLTEMICSSHKLIWITKVNWEI